MSTPTKPKRGHPGYWALGSLLVTAVGRSLADAVPGHDTSLTILTLCLGLALLALPMIFEGVTSGQRTFLCLGMMALVAFYIPFLFRESKFAETLAFKREYYANMSQLSERRQNSEGLSNKVEHVQASLMSNPLLESLLQPTPGVQKGQEFRAIAETRIRNARENRSLLSAEVQSDAKRLLVAEYRGLCQSSNIAVSLVNPLRFPMHDDAFRKVSPGLVYLHLPNEVDISGTYNWISNLSTGFPPLAHYYLDFISVSSNLIDGCFDPFVLGDYLKVRAKLRDQLAAFQYDSRKLKDRMAQDYPVIDRAIMEFFKPTSIPEEISKIVSSESVSARPEDMRIPRALAK